jgi:hypothetical protein
MNKYNFELSANVNQYSPEISGDIIEINRILKKSPTRQNLKCCRFGLIEPVMDGLGKCKLPINPYSHEIYIG